MATIRRLIPTENQEQRALVQWIRIHSILRDFIVKLNNEGKRNQFQGYNLKRMGMMPGASDLFLAYPTARHHGLWLEVKQNRKYKPSEKTKSSFVAQKLFLERMISVGFAGEFCYGFDHGRRVIESYLLTVASV